MNLVAHALQALHTFYEAEQTTNRARREAWKIPATAPEYVAAELALNELRRQSDRSRSARETTELLVRAGHRLDAIKKDNPLRVQADMRHRRLREEAEAARVLFCTALERVPVEDREAIHEEAARLWG